MENNDCVLLHEGVTYLWDNDEAIPIKVEEVEGFRKVGAPLFRLVGDKIIPVE